MTRLKLLLFVILAGTIVVPAVAESAESDYKAGDKAERKNNFDAAFQAYKKAHDLKPADPKYMSAFVRMRFYAAAEHIRKGQSLRDSGSIQESLAEFRIAAEMDPTNFEALGEMRRTADVIQRQALEKENAKKNNGQASSFEKEALTAAGPVTLDIKWDTPISLHLNSTTVDVVYKTIAKIAGINVLVDPDYKPQKINFELQDVNLRQAMEMIAMQSKTFWRPVSANTIMVAADTGSKRKELERERHEDVLSQERRFPRRPTAGRRNSEGHSRYQPHPGHPGTALAHFAWHARPDGSGPETAHRHRQAQG